MNRLLSRSRAAFLISIVLTLVLTAGVSASVRATSLLTQARLFKSGDVFGILHNSGFTFTLPSDQDFTVYEAKDPYGIRKLYLASSKGTIVEVSTVILDSFAPGALDSLAMSLYSDSRPAASNAKLITAAGIEGLSFMVRSRAVSPSAGTAVKVHLLLTDYEKAIIITAYTQEAAIAETETLLSSLISAMILDDSWAKATL